MAYLRGFDEDLFISYAHLDDDRYATEPTGWVAQLHRDLERRVGVYLGAEVKLWRDGTKLRNNDDFTNKIFTRLVRTATLLAIISPRFFTSDWCPRELTTFATQAEATGLGIRIDEEKFRIFTVEKISVDRRNFPQELRGSLGYKFYGPDPEHEGELREYRPLLRGDDCLRYFRALDQLAKDIAETLQRMAAKAKGIQETRDVPAVYVAEPTSDLHDEANDIRRDLKERGYIVLPSEVLPTTRSDLVDKVGRWLKSSVLSVHLIGPEYGFIPEGELEKSSAWLQHDLALERGADPSFKTLIWMRKNVHPSDVRQQRFFDYLREDPKAQRGVDLLETTLEDLKAILQEHLQEILDTQHAPPAPAVAKEPGASPCDEPLRVYLICDQLDRGSESLVALRKFLFNRGFEPMLPPESVDEHEALQAHADNLNLCDGCLIYYGQGSDRWFQAKLMDFRKVLSRRQPQVLAKGIYLAPPETPAKRELETHEAVVLRGAATLSPDALAPFLNQLCSGRMAPA